MRTCRLQTLRPLAVALLVAGLGFPAAGCTVDESENENWSYRSDAATDDADRDRDTGSVECGPGETLERSSGECEADSTPDTGVPPADTGAPDTSSVDTSAPDDPPDTGTPSRPTAGERFEGPPLVGTSDVPVEPNYGLALYWKNALVQYDNHALHRHLGDQKIVDLSRIQSPVGDTDFRANLPTRPKEKLHFYREYCEEARASTCANQGIDDEKPTFALAMLGLHRAPSSRDASDCTWRMVYGKRRCDFGQLVAPSQVMLLYAYRDFRTSRYPLFKNLDIQPTDVSSGYHLIVRVGQSPGDSRILPVAQTGPDVEVRSTEMFPMLYP